MEFSAGLSSVFASIGTVVPFLIWTKERNPKFLIPIGLVGALVRTGGVIGCCAGLLLAYPVYHWLNWKSNLPYQAAGLLVLPPIILGLLGLYNGIHVERSHIGWWV